MRTTRSRSAAAAATAAALLAVVAGTPAQAHDGDHGEVAAPAQAAGLAVAVSAQVHRYEDWRAAQDDGFVRMPGCVDAPDGVGTMGEHWVRFDRIDGQLRLAEPEVLLYLPTADGGFRLLGAEYVSTAAGARLAGVPLQPGPGASALHVWSEVENPAGALAPFNPAVTCGLDV